MSELAGSPPVAPSAPAPPPRKSFGRFLFRTKTGIALLVLGLLVLVVVFAPQIAERAGPGYASSWFAEHYKGQLSIQKLDLGWVGPQKVEGVELQDPSGARVARIESATLPGLWALATSGGKRLGKLQLVGEATLYADATGRTNLENALEPREPPKEPEKKEPGASDSSASLKELDVDLDVLLTKVYWADEHTRELGAPFVLENVSLAAALHPDQPMTAKMRGTLTGSGRSDLSFDARVEHPFDAPSSSTPPRADVSAEVAHFPTALLDAVARQGGRLQSLLGEELSLQLSAKGTVEQGSFDLRVDSPHGQVRSLARFENGILRAEGDGFRAEFDVQQEFVERVTGPLLAAGTQLAHISPTSGSGHGFGPDGYRLGFGLSAFEAPIGAYLEASSKGHGAAALDALLTGIRAQFTASLGDWAFRDSTALAGRGPLIVRELELRGEIKAPAEESSLQLEFIALNPPKGYDPNSRDPQPALGRASVSLTFSGGASLAKFTPSSALAPVRARVKLTEVPSALFDSLAGLGGDLTRALGPSLALDVDTTTSIEAATNSDLTWSNVGARWRELGARVSEKATFDLRGTPTGMPLSKLGDQIVSVHSANGRLELAPTKPLDVFAQLEFETPAVGHFDFTASLGELFADPATKVPLRFSLASKANGLPAKALDALAGCEKPRIQPLLGNLLAFEATAQGTLEEGVARIDFSSEKSQVLLVGRLQNGMFVNLNDEPVLSVSLQPDAALLDEVLAPYLPKSSRLAFMESRGVVGVNVNFLALPVAELLDVAKKSPSDALALALAKTRLDAIVGLREFTYSDEALGAAKQRIDNLALRLDVELRPGDKDKPTPLSLDFTATSPSWGENPVELHVAAPHAPDLLEVPKGAVFAPIVARLHAAQLSTAVLDAYAGGALHEPLGPKLDLTLDLSCSQIEKQPFAADAKLELSAAGGKSLIRFGAKVDDPFYREGQLSNPSTKRPADVLPALDATLDVSGAGSLLAFAPASARDLLRGLCGDEIAAKVKLAASKPGSNEIDLVLDAGGLAISGALNYVDRNLSTKEAEPLILKVTPTQATLDKLLAGKLPVGASLKLAPGAPTAMVVQLTHLHVPLGEFDDADPSLARSGLIENLDGQLDATLPPFTYTNPPAADGTPGGVVALREVVLHSRMTPRGPATVDLTGNIEATPPGGIEVHVVVEKPAGFAVEPPAVSPAPGSRAKLDAKLKRFPSALLDLLAKQDGLLVDVLGPELEASVRGEYPSTEPLRAEMHSTLGDIGLVSRIEGGVVVSAADQGLDAKVGLTPLFSKRIVGALVPMLVQVKQNDASKRTVLTGRKLALPLDADLSKLSGEIVLDLGAVDYQLLPTLSQALSLTGKEFGEKNTVIQPIAIQIVDGIARYDRIPIKISGREINFHGSANLAQKTFELAFAVPLEMLGSKVEAELESVRKYLDPKLEVPLEISGTWSSPKLRLGKGFLEKALKDAGKRALEDEVGKGLGDLFGGGKKKKKDG